MPDHRAVQDRQAGPFHAGMRMLSFGSCSKTHPTSMLPHLSGSSHTYEHSQQHQPHIVLVLFPMQEASLIAALRHPNITQFLAVCTVPPCMVTEYCSRGSLFDLLRAASSNPAKAAHLTWPRRLTMVGQLVTLRTLKKQCMPHRRCCCTTRSGVGKQQSAQRVAAADDGMPMQCSLLKWGYSWCARVFAVGYRLMRACGWG
jgi:hypothetical protein